MALSKCRIDRNLDRPTVLTNCTNSASVFSGCDTRRGCGVTNRALQIYHVIRKARSVYDWCAGDAGVAEGGAGKGGAGKGGAGGGGGSSRSGGAGGGGAGEGSAGEGGAGAALAERSRRRLLRRRRWRRRRQRVDVAGPVGTHPARERAPLFAKVGTFRIPQFVTS